MVFLEVCHGPLTDLLDQSISLHLKTDILMFLIVLIVDNPQMIVLITPCQVFIFLTLAHIQLVSVP